MTVLINRSMSNGKSAENRRKFLNRIRENIKDAMPNILKNRRLKDIGTESETVVVPQKSIKEPTFVYNGRVDEEIIVPGNKKFVVGDKIKKPKNGEGKGGKEGSPEDDGSRDDFTIEITREEFLKYFFDDLELPDLIRKEFSQNIAEYKNRNAGWQSSGPPAKLSVIRTMRSAKTRKIALRSAIQKEIVEIKEKISNELAGLSLLALNTLKQRLEKLQNKLGRIPFLDTLDLRYHSTIKEPQYITNATMFALSDVSGSMGEREKTLARKFFFLLYMFLKSRYEKVEVVYIIHTAEAKQVTEEEFFTSQESGGTVVSTAIELTLDLIKSKYSPSKTNIYVCQCSDGDNYSSDNAKLIELLENKLLPLSQYYAYIQIEPEESNSYATESLQWSLWGFYDKMKAKNFAMTKVRTSEDIYPVFHDLFQKRENCAEAA